MHLGCSFGPESSRQTLESPIFRSGLVSSVADSFWKCIGDKSATLYTSQATLACLGFAYDRDLGKNRMLMGHRFVWLHAGTSSQPATPMTLWVSFNQRNIANTTQISTNMWPISMIINMRTKSFLMSTVTSNISFSKKPHPLLLFSTRTPHRISHTLGHGISWYHLFRILWIARWSLKTPPFRRG